MDKKPALEMTTEIINTVDSSDFEVFVQLVYNCNNYDFCATQEADNDSYYKFYANIDTEHEDDLENIRLGKIYSNHSLFDCLAIDRYIEPGVYLISVCW